MPMHEGAGKKDDPKPPVPPTPRFVNMHSCCGTNGNGHLIYYVFGLDDRGVIWERDGATKRWKPIVNE